MKRNSRRKRYNLKNKGLKKRSIGMALTVLLLISMIVPSFADATNTLKEEVIYINLNLDGSVNGIYVINSFELSEDGKIIDYGDYTAFRELTESGKIQVDKERIEIDAKAGKLYYEGTLRENSIPWTFNIKYFLDGIEYEGRALAGKSGDLEIRMVIEQNKEVINTFFDSFALQVGFNFDSIKCKNIIAEGATLANAGKNKQVNFTLLPGKGGNIEIFTNVNDFEMEGITVNAIPMNMDFDFEDDPEMKEKLAELRDGVVKLDDGVKELRDGTRELSDGAGEFRDGVEELKDGVVELADGTEELADNTEEFVDGVRELDDGVKDLSEGSKELKDGAKKLDKGARDLLKGARDLHGGMKDLRDGLSTLSSQNNAIVAGAKQIFESTLAAANGELAGAMPGAPVLTKDNFKSVLDGMLEQIGGNAFQAAMAEAEASIRALVTAGVREQIEMQYPGAPSEIIDGIMEGEDVQSLIEANVSRQLRESEASIMESLELELGSNPQYAALVTLRAQLTGIYEFYNGLKLYTGGVSDITSGSKKLTSGMGEWLDGMEEFKDGTREFKEGTAEFNDGVIELKDGVAKLLDGSIELNDGIIELNDGVIELKDGVIKLFDGAIELHDGTVELYDGTVTLAEGTFEFRDKTADMEKDLKDIIKEKIDEMLGRNFKLISFVSEKNTHVESVQFVMKTEAISMPEVDNQPVNEKEAGFIDRLKALFGL